ncbi:MAG: hypothetical protein NZ866_02460 [Patescibacteria group bacterium]|nr:hypothetical protein [Patescibacteria group bacterium]
MKFEPQIDGKWLDVNNDNFLLFKPKHKLELGNYYTAILPLANNNEIKSDFLVVEDPYLVDIFPKGIEIPINSEFTFVFSRPIVPITSLDNPNLPQPVEIYPKIEGKFKWISTNILQFIPKKI